MEYQVIILGLVVNLVAVLGVGWKISRFIARMEFKLDLLWSEYLERKRIAGNLLVGIQS